jgi:hypothetical protein
MVAATTPVLMYLVHAWRGVNAGSPARWPDVVAAILLVYSLVFFVGGCVRILYVFSTFVGVR